MVTSPARSSGLYPGVRSPANVFPRPAVVAWHDGAVRRLAPAACGERRLPEGTPDAGRLLTVAAARATIHITANRRGVGPRCEPGRAAVYSLDAEGVTRMAVTVTCNVTFVSGAKVLYTFPDRAFVEALRSWASGTNVERGYWYDDERGSHFINFQHIEQLVVKAAEDTLERSAARHELFTADGPEIR
jgi:hypothetical protein